MYKYTVISKHRTTRDRLISLGHFCTDKVLELHYISCQHRHRAGNRCGQMGWHYAKTSSAKPPEYSILAQANLQFLQFWHPKNWRIKI